MYFELNLTRYSPLIFVSFSKELLSTRGIATPSVSCYGKRPNRSATQRHRAACNEGCILRPSFDQPQLWPAQARTLDWELRHRRAGLRTILPQTPHFSCPLLVDGVGKTSRVQPLHSRIATIVAASAGVPLSSGIGKALKYALGGRHRISKESAQSNLQVISKPT
jgi:hypothetical protein